MPEARLPIPVKQRRSPWLWAIPAGLVLLGLIGWGGFSLISRIIPFTGPPTQTQEVTSAVPPTSTPTNTPVNTPTATPAYSHNPLYLSLTNSQTIGGVSSANEDILKFDGTNWSLYFKGSKVEIDFPRAEKKLILRGPDDFKLRVQGITGTTDGARDQMEGAAGFGR